MMVSKQTNNSSKSLAEISVSCRISSASGQYFSGWAILMVHFGHPHPCHDAIASLFPEACLIVCMHLLPCLMFRMQVFWIKEHFFFVYIWSLAQRDPDLWPRLLGTERMLKRISSKSWEILQPTDLHAVFFEQRCICKQETFLLANNVKLSVHTSSDYIRELCWIFRTGFFKKEAV